MRERARMAGGELIIGGDGEQGASIRVRFPLESSGTRVAARA